MTRYRFTPRWRRSAEVEVVLHPGPAWFSRLTHARFALMEDGDLFWGDANTVLHQDMCQIEGPSKANAMVVGIVVKLEGKWRFGYVQQFLAASSDLAQARKLLRKVVDWREDVRALGNDPCAALVCGAVRARRKVKQLHHRKRAR